MNTHRLLKRKYNGCHMWSRTHPRTSLFFSAITTFGFLGVFIVFFFVFPCHCRFVELRPLNPLWYLQTVLMYFVLLHKHCELVMLWNYTFSSPSGTTHSRHPLELKHSRQPLTLYTFSSFSGTVHSWYLYCYNYHWSIPLLVDYLFLRVPSA
jgi:hypothetical protein